ncbi:MAG: energy transducer TonB [Terriglobales bacterium]
MLRLHVWITLGAIVFLSLYVGKAPAQTVYGPDVEFVELSPPKYPPLARTARISGDVKLEIQLRPDGTVSSVRVISGHPLLAPAAVASVKVSRFACYSCVMPATYIFNYTFGFREDSDCGLVTLRSPKCFYFWKCGRTEYRGRAALIVKSKDRLTIGVDGVCVETDTARNRKQ